VIYWRPLVQAGPRPAGGVPVAGGGRWFVTAERRERGGPPELLPAADMPGEARDRIAAPRPALAGLTLDRPRIMGILNATPDSFSDGGLALDVEAAARDADILDVGGESTRPGATEVPADEEMARALPVVRAAAGAGRPVSIDTRKAAVARGALAAGAAIVNDVSALTFDSGLAGVVAEAGVPVILMHHQGSPETMQDAPHYEDVLLDVCDWLEDAVGRAVAAGIARERVIVDPGIGFGKTVEHNLTLIRGLALLHGLGCPVLLGASRKGFVGKLTGVTQARDRSAGSIAVALAGAAEGVHILRVHDIAATRQALTMWQAVSEAG
jgi:dihydropteroate synthase